VIVINLENWEYRFTLLWYP